MILNDFNDTIQDESIEKIGVNVNNLTFNLMIDGIYTNKLHSVIRELCTNARDSIIEAKKGKLIVSVSSTPVGIKVSIKDTGLGLSEEDARKYLCNLNASSKRNSNDAVGCLGIGSKSAFSLVSHYRYLCVKDSVETSVELFRIEREAPRFVVTTQHTVKEDSVECILDIPLDVITTNPNTALKDTLVAIVSETCLFDIPIELYIEAESFDKTTDYFEDLYPDVFLKDSFYILDFTSKDSLNYSEGIGVIKSDICEYLRHYKHVACGVVAYKSEFIPVRPISLITTIIKTELGQLTFDSSRENIENTTTNKTILSNIIQNFGTEHQVQTKTLELFSYFIEAYPHSSDGILPSTNGAIDVNTCLDVCLNVIKQYFTDEDYRHFITVVYSYYSYYSTDERSTSDKYIFIEYLYTNVLNDLRGAYLSYSSKKACLTYKNFRLFTSLITSILKKRNLYSYSKSYNLEGTCHTNTEDNKIIFITTNENINPLSSVLSSLNEKDKTLISYFYMKKEGFTDDVAQSCMTKIVTFLEFLGFSAIHFNKLKELNQVAGYTKYYDKIKPASVRNSRTSVNTNNTITVGEQTVETSADGLVLRVTFNLTYCDKGSVFTLENITSVKACNHIKSLLSKYYSTTLLYIPASIISSDEDRDEFLKVFSSAFIIFEYQNDIEKYILEPLLSKLKSLPDTYIDLSNHKELSEEDIEAYKKCYAFYKYREFIEEKRKEYHELANTVSQRVYNFDAFSPLPSLNSSSHSRKAALLWYSSSYNNYHNDQYSFIFYKYFLNKVYTQEELEELYTELKNMVPVYDLQKHFDLIKGFLT